jgi:hypothetical protein
VIELPLDTPLTAGVDWFSASINDPESRRGGRMLWATIRDRLEREGRKTQPTQWKGYDLDVNGSFRYGTRQVDDYVEIRGEAANQWWLYFYPLASHVARIDVQTTWKPDKPLPGLARKTALATWGIKDRGPSPPQIRMCETFGGGQTMYLGAAKSDRIGRIYDKGLELGTLDPGVLWRYEVQYRNDPAGTVAKHAANASRRGALLASLVATHYKQRYIAVPWQAGLDDVPIVVHRAASTDETIKQWLRSTVAPVCRRLSAAIGPTEVLGLIGLN